MRIRRWMIVVAIIVAAVVAAVSVAFAVAPRSETHVSASSIADGSSVEALQSDGGDVWTSDGETVGAWVEITWNRPTQVDRVRVTPASAELGFTAATLVFDDGSGVHLTPASDGSVDVDFTGRSVSSARLTVASVAEDAEAVSLTRFSVDTGGAAVRPSDEAPTASASSTAGGSSTDALLDGDPAAADTAAEWLADPADSEAWVQFDWQAPREVASVQVYGPATDATDPGYSAAAPLNGRLVFDDGSSVVVSGIDGGDVKPTTIAFMPRVTSTVRLELSKTIEQATIGLRGLVVNDAGTSPSSWPVDESSLYSSDPDAAEDCSDTGPSGAALAGITLLCPTPGRSVDGEATIVVQSPDDGSLDASVLTVDQAGGGSIGVVATEEPDSDGVAVFTIDTANLAHGPIAIRITQSDSTSDDDLPLYVQLFNTVGLEVADAGAEVAAGMTLQWSDEFDGPLSVSYSGEGADYAATKPQYWGGSEFGEAVLDKPDSGADTFETLDDDYLRIRVLPLGDSTDTAGWDRRHTGGLLSSLDIGASGFSSQYGYYEARILGPAGKGTWPAFWMLNTQSATMDDDEFGEVDAVELYGHDTTMSCHSIHQWIDGEDGSDVECLEPNGYDDWAMAWHTYGVRVTPNGADFYIDGDLVMSKTGLLRTEEPFYFMLNLELGGGWPVDLSATKEMADLYVDYIRVYN